MKSQSRVSSLVFTVYITVSFYVLGGSMVNALVGYPTWHHVGADEFARFHQADSARIVPVFVMFFLFSFVPQILLLWFRPQPVAKWLVVLALACNGINLVSTMAIQIPIQLQLDQGYSEALIDRLIATDLIFRRTTISLIGILNAVMLYRVVRQAAER